MWGGGVTWILSINVSTEKAREGGYGTSTNDIMLEAPDGCRTCGLDGVDGSAT